MTILDQLADYARERVARDREKISFEEVRLLAKDSGKANGKVHHHPQQHQPQTGTKTAKTVQ